MADALHGRELVLAGDSVMSQMSQHIENRCKKHTYLTDQRVKVSRKSGEFFGAPVRMGASLKDGTAMDGYDDASAAAQTAWAAWERDLVAHFTSPAGNETVSSREEEEGGGVTGGAGGGAGSGGEFASVPR